MTRTRETLGQYLTQPQFSINQQFPRVFKVFGMGVHVKKGKPWIWPDALPSIAM